MSPTPAPTRIDEIVDGIYRICTSISFEDGLVFQFNQFLIDDERPALIHTGMHQMYDNVRDALGLVVDPAKLGYVILLHFEADECGAWTASSRAPRARLSPAPS